MRSLSSHETCHKRLTIQVPGRYHPCALQLQQESPQEDSEEVPTSLHSNKDNNACQYVGHIHQFPAHSTRLGLVCNAGGAGALFAYGAFKGLEPAFTPTPAMADPQMIHKALKAQQCIVHVFSLKGL